MPVDEERIWLENRFKIIFVIKELWKANNRGMDELLQKLFPSKRDAKKGNRSLYDRVMRLESLKFSDWMNTAEQMGRTVGINDTYFLGASELKISTDTNESKLWKQFISLREKERGHSDAKNPELIQIESKIKSEILKAAKADELKSKSEAFKRIAFFAEYGEKRAEKSADQLLLEVEKAVGDITYGCLQSSSTDRVKRHYAAIKEYEERIQAVLIIEKWCQ
jgi:hypothetical protein